MAKHSFSVIFALAILVLFASATVAPAQVKPQVLTLAGTLSFDNERLFIIRNRFPVKVIELAQVQDGNVERPLRFGDKVRQGEQLAVLWRQSLGQAKSALAAGLCDLALSGKQFQLKETAFNENAYALMSMKDGRGPQSDPLIKLATEPSLRTWKLTAEDITEIETAAAELKALIIGAKRQKSIDDWLVRLATKFARIEIRAPAGTEH